MNKIQMENFDQVFYINTNCFNRDKRRRPSKIGWLVFKQKCGEIQLAVKLT